MATPEELELEAKIAAAAGKGLRGFIRNLLGSGVKAAESTSEEVHLSFMERIFGKSEKSLAADKERLKKIEDEKRAQAAEEERVNKQRAEDEEWNQKTPEQKKAHLDELALNRQRDEMLGRKPAGDQSQSANGPGGTNGSAAPHPETSRTAGEGNTKGNGAADAAKPKRSALGSVFAFAGRHKIATTIGATMLAVEAAPAVMGVVNDGLGVVELARGASALQRGDNAEGERDMAEGAAHLGIKRLLSMFLPSWAASGLSLLFARHADELVDGVRNQLSVSSAPAVDTAPQPVADHSPVVLKLTLSPEEQKAFAKMTHDMRGSGFYTGPDMQNGEITADMVKAMKHAMANQHKRAGYHGTDIDSGEITPDFVKALSANGNVWGFDLQQHRDVYEQFKAAIKNPQHSSLAPDAPALAPAVSPAGAGEDILTPVQKGQALLREAINPRTGQPYYAGPVSGDANDAATREAVAAFQAQHQDDLSRYYEAHPNARGEGAGELGRATLSSIAWQYERDILQASGGKFPAGVNPNDQEQVREFWKGEVADLTRREIAKTLHASPTAYSPGAGEPPLLHNAVLTGDVAGAAAAARAAIHQPSAPTGQQEASLTPAAVSPVPTNVVMRTAVANDNLAPHSDMPAAIPAPSNHSGFRGWMDALSLASAGATFIPVVGNIVGAIGQGIATVGETGADVAEGRLGAAARDFTIGAAFTAASVVPGGGAVRLAAKLGVEESGVIARGVQLAGKAINGSVVAVPAASFAAGVAGIGGGSDVHSDSGMPPAAPLHTPTVANDQHATTLSA